MLDAYIIDRIRREQDDAEKDTRTPLHIERRAPRDDRTDDRSDEPRDDRGTTVIDFDL